MVKNIKEYLITADEARKETDQFYDKDNPTQTVQEMLFQIKDKISKAVDNGEYSVLISLNRQFFRAVKPFLEELGYKVSSLNGDDDDDDTQCSAFKELRKIEW